MFRLSLTPTFSAPVIVEFQGGGRAQFDAVFHRLSQTEIDALTQRIQSGEASDSEICTQVLAGWSGVAEDDGTVIPFIPSNVTRVLDVAGVRAAVVRAFFESFPTAKRKN